MLRWFFKNKITVKIYCHLKIVESDIAEKPNWENTNNNPIKLGSSMTRCRMLVVRVTAT